jgi:tol-pal system protein YbgF
MATRINYPCLCLGLIVAAGCTTISPTEDPMYLKMTDLEARLVRIERVMANQSLIELSTRVDQLRAEAQELRGQIETLRYETENNAERQRNLYLDVDQRLQSLEQGQQAAAMAGAGAAAAGMMPSAAPPAGSVAPRGAMPAGNDQQAYQAAFDLLRAARYDESANAFAEFLVNYPTSPLLDNAQYWLAETYYVRRDFDGALGEFQKVIDSYPDSAKLPDALLKVGFCNYELKNFPAARAALEQVTRQYPDTTAARLAAQRLERLTLDGG